MTSPALAFPLKATFRILTLSPEVRVENARGELLLQVKQKLLSLREATTIFADEAKTVPVYKMLADRVIGFRAVHRITRASDGAPIGAVKAGGLRTIWQARYEVTDAQDKLSISKLKLRLSMNCSRILSCSTRYFRDLRF